MTDSIFDASLYTRPPVLTIESGISVSRGLYLALPRGMPASVKKSADKLRRVSEAAQDALAQRQRELAGGGDPDDRVIDVVTDQAWRSMLSRVDTYGQLPAAEYPKATRAAELHVRLAQGLNDYLMLPYAEQVVAMDTVLQRIDEDGLAGELDTFCGPEFLENVRRCQARYRRMVQRRMQSAGPSDNLATHVKTLGRTIVEYATRVLATIDDDDEGSLPRAQEALRPIDNHREALAKRSGASNTPPTPDPTPEPAPAPAPAPTDS